MSEVVSEIPPVKNSRPSKYDKYLDGQIHKIKYRGKGAEVSTNFPANIHMSASKRNLDITVARRGEYVYVQLNK